MEKLFAVGTEALDLLVWTIGAAAFSVVGLTLERFGLASIISGEFAVGVWAMGMGLVALYAGLYAIGYGQVLPRVRSLRAGDTDAA